MKYLEESLLTSGIDATCFIEAHLTNPFGELNPQKFETPVNKTASKIRYPHDQCLSR
jgi:hypothetical protein